MSFVTKAGLYPDREYVNYSTISNILHNAILYSALKCTSIRNGKHTTVTAELNSEG